MPAGSVCDRVIKKPRMKVFLLYTRLAGLNAAQEGEAWAGLGSYNPRSDSLSLQIDLSPPSVQAIAKLEKSPRSNRKAKQHATPNRPIGKQVQVELLQDTTSLKSRKGDTGK